MKSKLSNQSKIIYLLHQKRPDLSYQEIGKQFKGFSLQRDGLSKQRVGQIIKDMQKRKIRKQRSIFHWLRYFY